MVVRQLHNCADSVAKSAHSLGGTALIEIAYKGVDADGEGAGEHHEHKPAGDPRPSPSARLWIAAIIGRCGDGVASLAVLRHDLRIRPARECPAQGPRSAQPPSTSRGEPVM